MNDLNIAIEKQRQCIEDLKYCKIIDYKGFGKKRILIFNGRTTYPDGDTGEAAVQRKIDDGHYLSVEDFDSYHSADVEFTDLYSGKRTSRDWWSFATCQPEFAICLFCLEWGYPFSNPPKTFVGLP